LCTIVHGLWGGVRVLFAPGFVALRVATLDVRQSTPARLDPCASRHPSKITSPPATGRAPDRRRMRLLSSQLSKSRPIYGNPAQTGRDFTRPEKIFLSFPLPVKVTTRSDNQERQGEATTRSDKKHPAFFSKKEMTQAGRRRGRPDSVAQLLPVTNEKARSRKMHAFWRQSIRMRKEKGQGHLLTLPAMFW